MNLQITATLNETHYAVNLHQPRDISIPLRFDGVQLSVYGAPAASMWPYAAGGFVGDVNQGGSCNCITHSLTPHTNGTHTECVGHISSTPIAIHDILQETLIPVTLVTVAPQAARATKETYDPQLAPDDLLITRWILDQALQNHASAFREGVVIRTTPNEPEKITRNYDVTPPPFFSREGIRYLAELGVRHLLVDFPSVDRLSDDGKLTNHHLFWDVPQGSHTVDPQRLSLKTITELIYVPNDVADGIYVLNLQIAPFVADAAPSRPFLYEINRT